MSKKLVAIDLFSGCGGTTAGLKEAGIEVRVAVEIDETAVKTYSLNNKDTHVIPEDIRGTTGKTLKSHAKLKENENLILVACPPCQGFSSIGLKRKGDERNQLIFEYLRLIKELKPEFILMENVSGMLRGKGKPLFERFIKQVKEEYNVVYDVLNSADYGVPQTRKRLVLQGMRLDLYEEEKNKNKEFKFDLPPTTHSSTPEINSTLLPWVNADVILGLPPIKAGEEYNGEEIIYNHIAHGLSETNLKRIDIIRKNGGSRSALPEELVLNCHKNTKGHTDVYGIIDISKPAITLTSGCMSYTKGRYGHPYQNRALSAREAARLQSFPDDYIFVGNRGELGRQIGNAVPVKLAAASAKYFKGLMKYIN